ncbi:hypothetical protein BD309DRAFT_958476 [Dichomitus squalens]|nr:hypothetical protein BD309DRAFT_958476 [Dichomitus squalens]
MQSSLRYILAVVAVVATAFSAVQASPVPVSPLLQSAFSRQGPRHCSAGLEPRSGSSRAPLLLASIVPRSPSLNAERLGSPSPTGEHPVLPSLLDR